MSRARPRSAPRPASRPTPRNTSAPAFDPPHFPKTNSSRMNIHEYQARELFEKYGVAAPAGKVASTPEEAEAIARQLGAKEIGAKEIVVKAQIHAGGRG